MLFNSLVFLFGFLPTTLLGYQAVARAGRRAIAMWLIAASLVFYGWWNPPGIVLLLASVCMNYTAARLIMATESRPRVQSWITIAGVGANLAALVYFKYLVSLLGFLNRFFPAIPEIDPIILPLGISFFSFTQIGYLVDCNAGLTRDRNFLNYMLFVTFFPHLIAGPILHNRDIMPQFANPANDRLTAGNLSVGLSMFVIGLVKKTVFADPLSGWVVSGYAHTGGIQMLDAWHLALCYSLQLYFDFSGYSDMAIGLARMMNIRFPRNFESPYKATSVIDYWQRWHITLTRFLTSYLYTPMALRVMRWRVAHRRGVNRAAQQTVSGFASMFAGPLLVTMTLAGIWHGSGLTFLIFGLMHGIYLCVNHAWRLFRPARARSGSAAILACCLTTYVCVLAASVFFRAPSVTSALDVLAGATGLHGWGTAPSGAGSAHAVQLAALYGIVWFAPNSQQIMRRFEPVLGDVEAPRLIRLAWGYNLPSALAIGMGGALGVLAVGGTTEFLYFQF